MPFTDDMAAKLRAADVVVARPGAMTCAELAAAGCGPRALLIPSPLVADDHQTANASAMVAMEGARMLHDGDMNPQTLADEIEGMLQAAESRRGQLLGCISEGDRSGYDDQHKGLARLHCSAAHVIAMHILGN